MSQFRALSADCSEDMILTDKTGTIRHQDNGHGADRPEISRNALTELLLSSVPEDLIRWETKVVSVTALSGGKWSLVYKHKNQEEQKEEFDLVIGADGAWSKARDAIPGVERPVFSGVSVITLTIPHLSTTYPHLASLVGRGSFSAVGDHKAMMSQRGSMDSARLYLMLYSESGTYLEDMGLEGLKGGELKGKLLGEEMLFKGWGESVRELVAAGCDTETEGEVEARPLYMLPTATTWCHTPGLTLIGDAAHLMSPFAGQGVNCAMLDALELSEAIISGEERGVEVFEKQMWGRSRGIAEESYKNLKMIFEDENAPDEFVRFFESHGQPR